MKLLILIQKIPSIFEEINQEVNARPENNQVPLNRLLVETDSPWLAPDSFVNKRNDPTSTSYIVKKVAEIKKTSFEEIDEITTENAIGFFQLKVQ